MLRLSAYVSLLIIFLAPTNVFSAENCCVAIRLDVAMKMPMNGRPALEINLTNTGTEPLRFSNGFGPWAGPGQIRLVAMKLPGGELIDNQLRAMVDPALGPVNLGAGKALKYDVPLDEIYHELAAELPKAKNDIVLFWTYQLTTWDAKKSERLGGWLMISPTK